MLYRRFPGCRKRRSAHTTSHGRCQGAQRVANHPRVGDVRHQPVAQPAVVATTRPVCCGANKAPVASNGYRINQAGLVHSVRRRNQPSAVDSYVASVRTLSARRPLQWGGGRTRCYTVRGLCISTLHVSLIIRVLPRAESATACIFRHLHKRSWRHSCPRQVFPKHSPGAGGSDDGGAETRRKKPVKQVNYRTYDFFRSSLPGASGASRYFDKLAKAP